MGKEWKQWQTLSWTPKSLQMVTAATTLKDVASWGKKLWEKWKCKSLSRVWLFAILWTIQSVDFSKPAMRHLDSIFKRWDITLPTKAQIVKAVVWCWNWSSNSLTTWYEKQTHWKRPWCWETLRAGEGDDRGWDGWMASLTQWTWIE